MTRRSARSTLYMCVATLGILCVTSCSGVSAAGIGELDTSETDQANSSDDTERLENMRRDQFSKVSRECFAGGGTNILDDSNTFTITASEFSGVPGSPHPDLFSAANLEFVKCFLDGLDAPDSLYLKMSQSRAIDGMLTDAWNEFEATWSYHPDSGLKIIIERVGGDLSVPNG